MKVSDQERLRRDPVLEVKDAQRREEAFRMVLPSESSLDGPGALYLTTTISIDDESSR